MTNTGESTDEKKHNQCNERHLHLSPPSSIWERSHDEASFWNCNRMKIFQSSSGENIFFAMIFKLITVSRSHIKASLINSCLYFVWTMRPTNHHCEQMRDNDFQADGEF